MDWILPFSPSAHLDDETRRPRPPHPMPQQSREERAVALARRWREGFQLWHPADWRNENALPEIFAGVGLQGGDRRANGTDRPAELAVYDPFDEFADDHAELPDGWLDAEREAFAARRIEERRAA